MSSAAFLVYIAAVLFYKPIFTQPLRFILCAAGAVEKSATERAVGVVYLRDSIDIPKINAAFLTGQQIDRIHVQQLLLPSFMCQGHNTSRFLLSGESGLTPTLRAPWAMQRRTAGAFFNIGSAYIGGERLLDELLQRLRLLLFCDGAYDGFTYDIAAAVDHIGGGLSLIHI